MQFTILISRFFAVVLFSVFAIKIHAQGFGGVTLSFSPSTIERGQSTRLTWSSTTFFAQCNIGGIGIDPISNVQSRGSITLSPTSNVEAFIICNNDFNTFASASLTVTEPADSVSVTSSFSPSTVNFGQSSIFRWSSTGATNCSSTGALSISGVSGSRTITPSSDDNVSVTVTCSGNGNSGASTSTLTVVPALPTIRFFPLQTGPGVIAVSFIATNATSCSSDGSDVGTSGTLTAFGFAGAVIPFSLTCTGPGGSTTDTIFIFVSGGGTFDTNINSSSQINSATSLQATTDVNVMDIVESSNYQSLLMDINNDGVKDLMGVDLLTQRLYILVNSANGQKSLSKVVEGISDISQLNSVSVSIDGDIVVTTTTQH